MFERSLSRLRAIETEQLGSDVSLGFI